MTTVRFSRRGIREAREARDWLKERQPKTVDGFRVRLREARNRLADFPRAGAASRQGTRRLPLSPYPYVLVYRLVAGDVEIVSVRHGRQRRGYPRP